MADSSNLHEKRWVQAHLSQHPNAEVLVFNHHADAVAIAAIQPGLNREVVFHHHCDHQLSLGASLSGLDYFDYVDVLTQRCRSAGLTPEILPLSVPRQSPALTLRKALCEAAASRPAPVGQPINSWRRHSIHIGKSYPSSLSSQGQRWRTHTYRRNHP